MLLYQKAVKKSTHDHNLKMDFILIYVSSQKNNFVIIKQDHLKLINKTVLGEDFCFVLVRKFFFSEENERNTFMISIYFLFIILYSLRKYVTFDKFEL